jgi:tetratricopeptide (TPR) repeat protein
LSRPGALPAIIFIAALSIGLAGCTASPGTYDPATSEWKPNGGWRPIRGDVARQPSSTHLRDASKEAFDAQVWRDSLQGYLALRARFPRSAEAVDVETSFNIAECYYHLGEAEYNEGYKYYLEVLKGSPPDKMLQTTLSRIYDIGISFLYGRAKKTFLGIPYRSPSFGVEVLTGENGLVTNYPFLPASEDALMEVAKYYFNRGEFAEAEKVYEQMVRDYRQSKWNPSAEYQLALSVYRQIRGVEYDQEVMRRARTKFNSYLNHHPRGDQVEEARRFLHQIAEMEGLHDLRIAKYYLRESQPQAAMLYLRSVFINNPNTQAAREANEIYENLEKRRGEIGG